MKTNRTIAKLVENEIRGATVMKVEIRYTNETYLEIQTVNNKLYRIAIAEIEILEPKL